MLFYCIGMCECLHVCMCRGACGGLRGQILGTGVTGRCEPPHVCVRQC